MNENKVTVNVENYEGIANIAPIGTFVFTILCFAFWAADLGLLHEGATLAIGLLGIAVFVPYLICGIMLCKKGNIVGGNTFLVFGAVFGACGGLFNTFNDIFAHMGIPFDYSVVGISFLLAGLYLLFLLPGVARATKIDFLIYFFGALGVIGSGLSVLGIGPASLNIFNGWALFLDGVVGFYSVIGGVMIGFGIELPMGKPFAAAK